MNCSRFRFLIQQSFDVSLLSQDARMLKQHMESCDGCAQFYANVDQLIEASPDVAPPDECLPANPESLARKIMEELSKEKGGGMDFFSQLKNLFSLGKKNPEKKEDSKENLAEGKKRGLNLPFPHIKRQNEKEQTASSSKNRKFESEDDLMATSARLKSLSRFNASETEQQQASGLGLGKKFGVELPNKGTKDDAPLSLAETIKRQVAEQNPVTADPPAEFGTAAEQPAFGNMQDQTGGGFGEPSAFAGGGGFGAPATGQPFPSGLGGNPGEQASPWSVPLTTNPESESSWGAPAQQGGMEDTGGWGSISESSETAGFGGSGWGIPAQQGGMEDAGGWGSISESNETAGFGGSGWGAPAQQGGMEDTGGWGSISESSEAAGFGGSGWGTPAQQGGMEDTGGWGSISESSETAGSGGSGWGTPAQQGGMEDTGGWGAPLPDSETWSEEGEQIQTGIWKSFSLEDTGLGTPQVAGGGGYAPQSTPEPADFDIPIQERMKAKPVEPASGTPVQPSFAPPLQKSQEKAPGMAPAPVPPPVRRPGPPGGVPQRGVPAPPGGRPPGGAPAGNAPAGSAPAGSAVPGPGRPPSGQPAPGGVFKNLDERAINKVFEQNLGVKDEANTQVNSGSPPAGPTITGGPATPGSSSPPSRVPPPPRPGSVPSAGRPAGMQPPVPGRGAAPAPHKGAPPTAPAAKSVPPTEKMAPSPAGSSGLLKNINEKDIDRIFSENLGVKDSNSSQVNKGSEAMPPSADNTAMAPPVIPDKAVGQGVSQPPKASPLPPKPIPPGAAGRSAAVPPPVRPGAPPPPGKAPLRPPAAPPPGKAPVAPAAKQGGMFNVDDSFMDRIFSENLGIKDNIHSSGPKINLRESVQSIREAAESLPLTPPPKVEGIDRLDAKASTVQDPGSGRISSIGKFLLDQQDLQKLGRLAEDDLSDSQIRVLTLEAADEINRLLEHVSSMEGVIGSVIVGHDGILIANNLPHEFDPESIGIWSLGVYVNTTSVAKKMGHNHLHQLVASGDGGTLVIADFGGGILVCVSESSTTDTLIPLMRNITQLVAQ